MIERSDETEPDTSQTLRYVLSRTLSQYIPAKQEPLREHAFAGWFGRTPGILQGALPALKPFKVNASVGKGNWASIPWITIRRPDISPSPQQGVYVAYLFRADMKGVYLSLNQGVSNAAVSNLGRTATLSANAASLRQQIEVPERFRLTSIDLVASGSLPTNYKAAHIWGIQYDREAIPEEDVLESDLSSMLEAYAQYEPLSPTVELGTAGIPDNVNIIVDAQEEYGISDLERDTLWTRDALNEVIGALQLDETSPPTGQQIILAGPPGTGKTWIAQRIVDFLTARNKSRSRLVQFHPSYSYEEFIEGLRPTIVETSLTFEVSPGIVLQLAKQCRASPDMHYVIMDELNRANLPRVLGELMYLFEYRDEELLLAHSGAFSLPRNIAFIGTMNTADRSIRSIDIALRRRFEVFECLADARILSDFYSGKSRFDQTNHVPSLIEGFEKLNERLKEKFGDVHHAIGHTFFMAHNFTPDTLRKRWERKIRPTIAEYFFDEPAELESFNVSDFWPDASL